MSGITKEEFDVAIAKAIREKEDLQTQRGNAYSNGRHDGAQDARAEIEALRSVLRESREDHARLIQRMDETKVGLFLAQNAAISAGARVAAAKAEEQAYVLVGEFGNGAAHMSKESAEIVQTELDRLKEARDLARKNNTAQHERIKELENSLKLASSHMAKDSMAYANAKVELDAKADRISKLEAELAEAYKCCGVQRATLEDMAVKAEQDARDYANLQADLKHQTALNVSRAEWMPKAEARIIKLEADNKAAAEAQLSAEARAHQRETERDAFGFQAKRLAEELDRVQSRLRSSGLSWSAEKQLYSPNNNTGFAVVTEGAFNAMKARFVEADASARSMRDCIVSEEARAECEFEDKRQAKLQAEGYDPEAKAWVQAENGGGS